MSNPYGWKSCGGSYGANLAARQQQQRRSGSDNPPGRGGSGGGTSYGSQFFTILILSIVVGAIGTPIAGVIAFIILFLLWRRKNRAESRTRTINDD